ncbi:unnamed protein product [Acanthoscelides obtectus]|uniref:GST C-terminal domain-containing protein n=1 Tax=Acanthoscelides obtectus TaxID=200917 RepID=A0A9P0JI19_ACAOB|nr:unnamed protein product [Acanthoscelides obtectus]CAK1678725.1 Glutathione S-transferase theta-1 [Acanthoscelides obtectus]
MLRLEKCFHDCGKYMFSSVAIVRYLTRQFKIPDHWYPEDRKTQAKIDEYLEWHHLGLRRHCIIHIWTSFILPMMTGRTPSESATQTTKKNMIKSLGDFQRLFMSEDKKYIVGDQISFADLQAACEVDQLRMVSYEIQAENFPKIKVWLENVRKECSPHYQELQKEVDELTDVYQQTTKSKL